MQLVFASANKHKIEEIKSILPRHITLLSLTDIEINEEIPETGKTIRENSFLKANFVATFLKEKGLDYPVFADDSGLEVEALNKAPGVHSARYAGVPKNDSANNKKLVQELHLVTKRQARFVTIITLIMNNNTHYFEGEVKGTIAYEAKGSTGFGYDPLFIPQGYRSTFAELGNEVKNKISHRSGAVNALLDFLKTVL
jgi:XTP/dITP diphosphohydrolase